MELGRCRSHRTKRGVLGSSCCRDGATRTESGESQREWRCCCSRTSNWRKWRPHSCHTALRNDTPQREARNSNTMSGRRQRGRPGRRTIRWSRFKALALLAPARWATASHMSLLDRDSKLFFTMSSRRVWIARSRQSRRTSIEKSRKARFLWTTNRRRYPESLPPYRMQRLPKRTSSSRPSLKTSEQNRKSFKLWIKSRVQVRYWRRIRLRYP